jgi:hypothetical protein
MVLQASEPGIWNVFRWNGRWRFALFFRSKMDNTRLGPKLVFENHWNDFLPCEPARNVYD